MVLCRGLVILFPLDPLVFLLTVLVIMTARLSATTRPFLTEVRIPSHTPSIVRYSSPVTFLGSCFSENISSMLSKRKFNVMSNPQGIAFNPISISNTITRCIQRKEFSTHDLIRDHLHGDIFHSWQHGREYSGIHDTEVLEVMNNDLIKGYEYLRTSSAIFVTLGTSFAYKLKDCENGKQMVVSNCHKQPASQFEKFTISPASAVKALTESFEQLKVINPTCRVVITVSPIRHTREGIPENSLSKAILVTAAHQLCSEIDFVSYFPSYEIMLDELRDYRFYTDDLIHPSNAAQEYIFEKFCHTYMSSIDINLMRKIESINKDMSHRPIVANCQAYKKHLEGCITKLNKLHKEMETSGIDLQEEICECEEKLSRLLV